MGRDTSDSVRRLATGAFAVALIAGPLAVAAGPLAPNTGPFALITKTVALVSSEADTTGAYLATMPDGSAIDVETHSLLSGPITDTSQGQDWANFASVAPNGLWTLLTEESGASSLPLSDANIPWLGYQTFDVTAAGGALADRLGSMSDELLAPFGDGGFLPSIGLEGSGRP